MRIFLQDPKYSWSYSLHEALIEACDTASYGAGVYAFVSRNGAEMLLADEAFINMIRDGEFNLIIGIDQITNERAVKRLIEINEEYTNLSIKAFYDIDAQSLFHPKFSWFRNTSFGKIIIGSGNLTIGGLRRNREAFSVVDCTNDQMEIIERDWNRWISESEMYLFDITNDLVMTRVQENQRRIITRSRISEDETDNIAGETLDLSDPNELIEWHFSSTSPVLIAEIPKASSRWSQANFDKNSFKNFFGATPGYNSQRILLRNVNRSGTLDEIEVRPSVSVKSHNYRFELSAAYGIEYPSEGRPIGVFIRISMRMFIYKLFLPTQQNYDQLLDWLNRNWTGRRDRMKRIRTNYNSVRHLFIGTPLETFRTSNNGGRVLGF